MPKFYRAAIFCWMDLKNSNFSRHFFWEGSWEHYIAEFTTIFVCFLDDIQWNEVATSTTRSFNNSRPLYLNFSIFDSLKMQNVSNFYFGKRTAKKQTFHVFKGSLFRNGSSYWYECWRSLRGFCGLSKMGGFATFPKILPNLCQFECRK